ncbi:MAG: cell division protein ZipA C-terminal FtsZ-binding domain-containing protein [Gallionella sp.]|nr:cell division protein ZipA C-terminal FtsZ-binding domain-containing protein [Gallionella sp.]
MSELQAALLVIGFGVVVAVYAFGWWRQYQYSRKFGSAFRQSHKDALYQVNESQAKTSPPDIDGQVAAYELPEAGGGLAESAGLTPVLPVCTSQSEPCVLLDARSDFIIALNLVEPATAAVLGELWQRKFDFRKPVQVCGLILSTGQWERVVAESLSTYSGFRVALQLVDRSGVISLNRLADFRDLVARIAQAINADITVPDIQATFGGAQSLDALCASVDQMVGVNLLPSGNRQLNGRKIAEAAALHGMQLDSDGVFRLSGEQGQSLVTLINQDAKPFQYHALEHFSTPGITLMLDVPRVENPLDCFDLLVKMAHALARELQVNLVDDNSVKLTEAGIMRIRQQIAGIEEKMLENNLVPGSAQALRLFS